MIKVGGLKLDSRSRILKDLNNLIPFKGSQSFHPIIIMMDANDGWLDTSSKTFSAFVAKMQMNNPHPLHTKMAPKALQIQCMPDGQEESTLSWWTPH